MPQVSDAVGTTLEFKPRDSYKPLTDMTCGGPFRLAPGVWTDDTSMALALAESLAERGALDPADLMERFVRWWRSGEYSAKALEAVRYVKAIARLVREGG